MPLQFPLTCWQQKVWDLMTQPTIYRTVHWIYSKTPGVGKTTMAKGLVTHL